MITASDARSFEGNSNVVAWQAGTDCLKPDVCAVAALQDDHSYRLADLLIPNHYNGTLQEVLVPGGLIQDRVRKLARDIRADYGCTTIHLVCVLKGGSAFFQDLLRCLRYFHEFNDESYVPFTYDFIRVKSYVGTQSMDVKITGGDLKRMAGKHVLLVEDIIDTGKSMRALLPVLRKEGPKSLKVASLLEKRTERSCGFKAHYVGFSIPDKFVVGYCIDYDEHFRDMTHLCVVNQEGIERYRSISAAEEHAAMAAVGDSAA
ncbi:phosphoribosyltransferase-like protein [Tribonema minus]|uniref:Hypoxanthine phosphoribosyltransferase n=1 Tax=Tribonema minus TaxID=303371 RepID=A0A835Z596_9STRA|nr:phosphoribosyltransferase-like protein [Tribonema minus]